MVTSVHFITGKGGTGKTTVAAALAVALTQQHEQVLLVEVEGRQGLSRVFDTQALTYDERLLVSTSTGRVIGLSIEPEAALLDYLEKFYNLGRAGGALKRIGAVDFATTIAPGLRDVLLTGKVSEIARGQRFPAIVVDAPPTGRIGRFLNVTAQVSDIAKIGPIRAHADLVKSVIHSADTYVHLVSTSEEMPVQEAIDAIDELTSLGLHVGKIFVNKSQGSHIHPDDLEVLVDRDVDESAVAKSLRNSGLHKDLPFDELAEALIEEATDFAYRAQVHRTQRMKLVSTGRPLVDLPQQPSGIDSSAIMELAARVSEAAQI